MTLPFHMTIQSESGQELLSEGACEMKGREDTILCYNIKHRVYIPLHLQSGRAKGERLHTPLTVTKAYDRSSPLLYSALVNQEILGVNLEFYRISKEGFEEKFFEIRLKEAVIVDIKNWMSTDFEKKTDVFTNMEDVSFAYKAIEWEHTIESTLSDDEWQSSTP
jgi:type VI secretion system secreted protein Hcp